MNRKGGNSKVVPKKRDDEEKNIVTEEERMNNEDILTDTGWDGKEFIKDENTQEDVIEPVVTLETKEHAFVRNS